MQAFLHERGLLPLEVPYVEPIPPPLAPPSDLEGHALDAFHAYQLGGPHKAFARTDRATTEWLLARLTSNLPLTRSGTE